jgi:hypothetical protein
MQDPPAVIAELPRRRPAHGHAGAPLTATSIAWTDVARLMTSVPLYVPAVPASPRSCSHECAHPQGQNRHAVDPGHRQQAWPASPAYSRSVVSRCRWPSQAQSSCSSDPTGRAGSMSCSARSQSAHCSWPGSIEMGQGQVCLPYPDTGACGTQLNTHGPGSAAQPPASLSR